MSKLLESSDSDSEQVHTSSSALFLNNDYAQRYDRWRGKEQLQKLKDKYGDDIESSESTSEEEWTPGDEKSFLTTLSSLKAKHSKIYDSSCQFFVKGESKPKVLKNHSKAFRVKDHERKMILGQEFEEEKPILKPPSYFEEQNQIKIELKNATKDSELDEDDNLLKPRIKTHQEINEEEEDYHKWLKGELNKLDDKGKETELKFLRDYWNNPKLDDGEQFLRDYVLERKYVEKDTTDYIPTYEEILHDSDEGGLSGDEKHIQDMETFETKFNFRFEEPDPEFIKKYPRTIEESYRRKESKRKDERERSKKRKEEEMERKVSEIQQLKALKRKEILEKLQKLHQVTGVDDLTFGDVDLEADFNPEEYDKKMNQIFGEKYYDVPDEKKPIFAYDEDIDNDLQECWDPDEGESDSKDTIIEKSSKLDTSNANSVGTSKMDIKSELLEVSKGKRMRKSLGVLSEDKPKYDPILHKSFEKYLEEYYKLDFEDLVGDLPCRFKYRQVTSNNFGLTTEEILNADDSELNQWASLKKTYEHRSNQEETYEVQAYAKKAGNTKAKKKILASIYDKKDELEDEGGISGKEKKKKRKKKSQNEANVEDKVKALDTSSVGTSRKRKRKKSRVIEQNESINSPTIATNTSTSSKKSSRQSRKGHKEIHSVEPPIVLSEDRLKAYGINPTKYKKRIKYGKS